jgi:RNA polymerase sigma-70 factor (ECF subfamily)
LPKVLNFIRLRVPDASVAEDLTGATFEQAFRKIGQLRSDEAFAGWLFRIARNEVGQYYRRTRFRWTKSHEGAVRFGTQERESSLDVLLDLPDPAETPFEAASRREELATVLHALATLTPREQEIVALRFVAGLTNHEIAQAMELGDSNVGVILFRAIRKVREQLGIDDERDP